MAYDIDLAERLQKVLLDVPGISEKKMFGGLAFLSEGHMFVGITGDTLMARVGPANYEDALAQAHVRVMDFTGKPMRGYVFVDADGLQNDSELHAWVRRCLDFVNTLPPKA
jgi:TfoX/Sxy family transcriptional regulator of competence genes